MASDSVQEKIQENPDALELRLAYKEPPADNRYLVEIAPFRTARYERLRISFACRRRAADQTFLSAVCDIPSPGRARAPKSHREAPLVR